MSINKNFELEYINLHSLSPYKQKKENQLVMVQGLKNHNDYLSKIVENRKNYNLTIDEF